MAERQKNITFNTETSINLADDPALMEMMVKAGFDTVFIGIETPNEESLAECNKQQNKNRNLIECVKLIQRVGLQVQGGFIVGFDNDMPSIFQRQIEFIQESGIVTAMVGLLQAPAGTKLYERLKQEGRLLGDMSGNTDGTTNIIPRMDFDVLREGYKKILRYIYEPRNYYQRVQTFLGEYKPPKTGTPLDFQRFLAFFRSSIRLGYSWDGTISVLETIIVDFIVPSQIVSTGDYAGDLWSSFPQNMQIEYCSVGRKSANGDRLRVSS